MEITVERRKVARTGIGSFGFLDGYCTVYSFKWCVLKDGKVIAECRSKKHAQDIEEAFQWVGHNG